MRPSMSPYTAPSSFVLEKDRKRRPIVNNRKLNEFMECDKYQLPLTEQMLQCAAGGNINCAIDLVDEFHQIEKPRKTSMKRHWSHGLYEWNNLPMEIVGRREGFWRMMDAIFPVTFPSTMNSNPRWTVWQNMRKLFLERGRRRPDSKRCDWIWKAVYRAHKKCDAIFKTKDRFFCFYIYTSGRLRRIYFECSFEFRKEYHLMNS